MNFTIDRQSLDELNLTGKFRNGSIYFLFNKIRTRMGEQLMDHMFSHPLTDPHAINERTAILQFFQQARMEFPFDAGQVALMREYIDAAGTKGRLNGYVDVLVKKVLSGAAHDHRYKALIQGLQASIGILQRCHLFVSRLSEMEGAFADRATRIRDILNNPELMRVVGTDIYKAIPVGTIAAYDHLLRRKLHPQISAVLGFIAEVDVYIAVSTVAAQRGFVYAHALPREANAFTARDLKHPGIEDAIGNEIRMNASENVIFLTGANMAGKSTWMKSIGIAMYLAHIGFPVAAGSMTFSVREGIYSSINVADNITLGYSHFYAEVVRVKNAAEATATGKYLLLMFDELFKGTNVKDAYDGTLAVTESFSEYRHCLFIVSTHIIEVGEALQARENIQFTYMPTVMEGGAPRYTYRLENGITEDRQGMLIIKNEGILDILGS